MISYLFIIAIIITLGAALLRRMPKRRKSEKMVKNVNIPSESETAFLVCTFSMLGKLAQADGCVSAEEVSKIREYIEKFLKLDNRRAALALKVFEDAASSPLELKDYAERFLKTYPDRVQLCDQMIDILVQLASADGLLSEEEDTLIRSAALTLGLTEPGYKRIKKKHTPSIQSIH